MKIRKMNNIILLLQVNLSMYYVCWCSVILIDDLVVIAFFLLVTYLIQLLTYILYITSFNICP